MKVKRNLSSLVSIPQMESDQEGMLVGGFTMLSPTDTTTPTDVTNQNCDCNTASKGCAGNGNCECNTPRCAHNENCNCDCGTTTSAPDKTTTTTTPTGMTGFVWGV